jgi:hypothetical protein
LQNFGCNGLIRFDDLCELFGVGIEVRYHLLDFDHDLGHRGQIFDAPDNFGFEIVLNLPGLRPAIAVGNGNPIRGRGLIDSGVDFDLLIAGFALADAAAGMVERFIFRSLCLLASWAGSFPIFLLYNSIIRFTRLYIGLIFQFFNAGASAFDSLYSIFHYSVIPRGMCRVPGPPKKGRRRYNMPLK